MIRCVLAILALLTVATTAAQAIAQEMKSPQVTVATADWQRAADDIGASLAGPPDRPFAPLNEATGQRFRNIADSPIPVLLPFDAEAYAKQIKLSAPDKTDDGGDRFLLGGFHTSKFFLAGPAGFDAAFSLRTSEVKEFADIRYADPVYVLFSGLRFTYELDGPALPEGQPVKDLEGDFPGIRRYLHESYIRYSFERYGVTYVAAIYCLDRRPRPKILTCRQADRIAERFLRALRLVGGTPPAITEPVKPVAAERPEHVAPEFTYFSPGFLIPGSGLTKDIGGRTDYTVYGLLQFPMKEAPAFANSQSFNNWGDCDFTGRTVRTVRKKGQPYACKVNGLPLVFDEAGGRNYAYPWRDNFCEHRNFFVGQCPGGEGHQGQDIRPGYCKQFNSGADRCEPYEHEVVAAVDGQVLRASKQEALYLFANTENTHLRVRYMHMNPDQLDAGGWLSGREVRAGDPIGKVGNYNKHERGTTYHLHFDLQVPTKLGFVFVSPYMTLVSAYERLIGARGTEIKDGDAVPPASAVQPVIARPSFAPEPPEVSAAPTQENAASRVKARKKSRHVRSKRTEEPEIISPERNSGL